MVIAGMLGHGLIIAVKLAENSTKWTQIPIAGTSIYIYYLLTHACYNCGEISKDLRALLIKNSLQADEGKLVEFFSQQIDMQPIEFLPFNIFLLNFEFLIDVVRFIIDYDIVFMQFYLDV